VPRCPAGGLRRLLLALLLGAAPLASPVTALEVPAFDAVFPLLPDDGAVSGSRPVFHLGYRGVAADASRHMRFRLALSEDGFASETWVFDQRQRRSGWVAGDEGEMLFRPPRPLPDGRYRWRVWAWNGVEWVGGGETRELRVDTVPPAEVEGLQVAYDPASRTVRLRWMPVTVDRDGAPEYVTRYHVYRYQRGPAFPRARPFLIGVTEIPEFVDTDPAAEVALLYYKVAAEDAGGNVTGVRD